MDQVVCPTCHEPGIYIFGFNVAKSLLWFFEAVIGNMNML